MFAAHANKNATVATGGTWTPASLATLPAGWWDFSDESTITLASGSFAAGGPISAIANKGSGASSAIQATSAKQPAYSRTAFNGAKSGATFNYTNAQMLTIASGMPTGTTATTVFGVASATTSTLSFPCVLFRGTSGLTGASAALEYPATTNWGYSIWGTANNSGITGINTPAVISGSADLTDNLRVYVNGTQASTASATGMNISGTSGVVGAVSDGFTQGYWAGSIAETLILGYLASTSDRQKVEGYLAWKWGLQANLPAGHPYKSSAP
jgi:hypothetical protein